MISMSNREDMLVPKQRQFFSLPWKAHLNIYFAENITLKAAIHKHFPSFQVSVFLIPHQQMYSFAFPLDEPLFLLFLTVYLTLQDPFVLILKPITKVDAATQFGIFP